MTSDNASNSEIYGQFRTLSERLDASDVILASGVGANVYDSPLPPYGAGFGAFQAYPTWNDYGPTINTDVGWAVQDPNAFLVPFEGIAPIVPVHARSNGFTAALGGSILAPSNVDLEEPILTLPDWLVPNDGWLLEDCGAWRLRWAYQDEEAPYAWHVVRVDQHVAGSITGRGEGGGQVFLAAGGGITPPDDDRVTSLIVDFGNSVWYPYYAMGGNTFHPVDYAMRSVVSARSDEEFVLDVDAGTIVVDASSLMALDGTRHYFEGQVVSIITGVGSLTVGVQNGALLRNFNNNNVSTYVIPGSSRVMMEFANGEWRVLFDSSGPLDTNGWSGPAAGATSIVQAIQQISSFLD